MNSVTQICIEAHYIDELLNEVPSDVEIVSISWQVGSHHKSHKLPIPSKLAKLGVGHMRKLTEELNVEGVFRNLTRDEISRNVDIICKETGHRRSAVRVSRCVLQYKKELASFERVIKNVQPKNTGKTHKVRVLGLTTPASQASRLMIALSAKKYSCSFSEVKVKQIICNKIT